MQVLTFRAGSAGGPKPGRAGFYLELARRRLYVPFLSNMWQQQLKAALRQPTMFP